MEARLRYIMPLTLVLVIGLLYLSVRGWPQTLLVLLSLLEFVRLPRLQLVSAPAALLEGGDIGQRRLADGLKRFTGEKGLMRGYDDVWKR